MRRAVLITGPEATGKSTLSQAVAAELGCPWVPEFAREFLRNLGRPYREADLERILEGQIQSEDEAFARSPDGWIVCDTGPEVLWVWSFFKYGRVSPRIDAATHGRSYAVSLLLDTDLPWAPDPLRENPDPAERAELLRLYRDLLERAGREYAFISGRGSARLRNALRAVRGKRS